MIMSGYLGIIAPLSSSLCNGGDADLACNVFIALPAHMRKSVQSSSMQKMVDIASIHAVLNSDMYHTPTHAGGAVQCGIEMLQVTQCNRT